MLCTFQWNGIKEVIKKQLSFRDNQIEKVDHGVPIATIKKQKQLNVSQQQDELIFSNDEGQNCQTRSRKGGYHDWPLSRKAWERQIKVIAEINQRSPAEVIPPLSLKHEEIAGEPNQRQYL